MSEAKQAIPRWFIRAPDPLKEAVEQAARQQFTSASAYVRAAVAARLRADGVSVAAERAA